MCFPRSHHICEYESHTYHNPTGNTPYIRPDLMRLEEGHHLLIRVPAVELWVTVPDRLDQEHHVRLVVGEHGTRHGTHESPVLGVALLDHDQQPVADVQPDGGTPLHPVTKQILQERRTAVTENDIMTFCVGVLHVGLSLSS